MLQLITFFNATPFHFVFLRFRFSLSKGEKLNAIPFHVIIFSSKLHFIFDIVNNEFLAKYFSTQDENGRQA